MIYFIKLLAEKQKMISFTKDNGETIAATVLQLYPHYFFDISKKDINGNFKMFLCSKSLSLRKQRLTKRLFCLFERRNLLPMSKILCSKVNNEILDKLIRDKVFYDKYNLIRFIHLDNLNCARIDIIAKSKGRGFTGTVKRYNFKQGPKTHGSKSYRRPGSIGAGTTPGRVLKNKRMAGHSGNVKVTLKNVEILLKSGYNLIVKGPVPGPIGKDVLIVVKF